MLHICREIKPHYVGCLFLPVRIAGTPGIFSRNDEYRVTDAVLYAIVVDEAFVRLGFVPPFNIVVVQAVEGNDFACMTKSNSMNAMGHPSI